MVVDVGVLCCEESEARVDREVAAVSATGAEGATFAFIACFAFSEERCLRTPFDASVHASVQRDVDADGAGFWRMAGAVAGCDNMRDSGARTLRRDENVDMMINNQAAVGCDWSTYLSSKMS